MDFLKEKVFVKENLDWLYLAILIGICYLFGANLWFTKIGFPAIGAMFGIAVVFSFFLRHIWSEDEEEEEEPDA